MITPVNLQGHNREESSAVHQEGVTGNRSNGQVSGPYETIASDLKGRARGLGNRAPCSVRAKDWFSQLHHCVMDLNILSFLILYKAAQPCVTPSDVEFKLLNDAYGFSSTDDVEVPTADSMILSPPVDKVGIYLKTFDAGLRLPLTDFQNELLQKNGCGIQMLTSNVVNKMVAFESIWRANGVPPTSFV
ncbi:unnamed protein product [Lactuca saligna]|uniref:Uncharacterized protein n=1 Tax=Lactuca saligna TaxID=75948 RepID=A0AA36ES05_LACSI|nr:unnamed protein product [Lactuca saligna]